MPHQDEINARLYNLEQSGGSSGASVLKGQIVVTVPSGAGRLEHTETVAAVGVNAEMTVLLSLGAHAATDENTAEMLDIGGMGAEAGADSITVTLSFDERTAGALRLNYMAA